MKQMDNATGLKCPSCNGNIKFSFEDLLFKNSIVCPYCNLQMDMTVPSTIKHHLQEIVLAEKMVADAKSFSH